MITVYLNTKETSIPSNSNLTNFLINSELNVADFAIAINEQFIPRDQYEQYILKANDKIELLIPMQGG